MSKWAWWLATPPRRLDRLHEMEVQVPGLRIVRELVAERALGRVGHDLLKRGDADVGVGDERNAVLDAELADEPGVGSFVVIVVAGQNIDDEIEAVFLEKSEDIRCVAVGDLMNFGSLNAAIEKKFMSTRC